MNIRKPERKRIDCIKMQIPFVGNSPIRKNMLANLFGVGVQLMNQIVLVPFYILFWGNELYSDWIIISALTAIFSMSDVGLNNVIQNRFAIKMQEGNKKECDALLTDNFILVGGTLVLTLIGCLIFVYCCDITDVMTIHLLTRVEASIVFIVLLIKVFIGMFSGIENAIYRSTHNASISTYMDQIGTLAVAFITLGCILGKVSIVIMSILLCIPQIILVVIKYFHARKYYDYSFSFRSANYSLLKEIVVPSLSFMSFPLGNTIVLQGYTLVINSFFGANSVVLYNTTRTLCNFIKTFLGTLQSAVWPEYSIAYGNNDFQLMRHIHRKILKITIVASTVMGGGLLILGPTIYSIWTRNAVTFSFSLMTAYVVALIAESLWTSSSVTLMATNNHTKLGLVYILSSSTCLGIATLFAKAEFPLWTIAATLILMHILIGTTTFKNAFKLLENK